MNGSLARIFVIVDAIYTLKTPGTAEDWFVLYRLYLADFSTKFFVDFTPRPSHYFFLYTSPFILFKELEAFDKKIYRHAFEVKSNGLKFLIMAPGGRSYLLCIRPSGSCG
jgi:hypothetical protein